MVRIFKHLSDKPLWSRLEMARILLMLDPATVGQQPGLDKGRTTVVEVTLTYNTALHCPDTVVCRTEA